MFDHRDRAKLIRDTLILVALAVILARLVFGDEITFDFMAPGGETDTPPGR